MIRFVARLFIFAWVSFSATVVFADFEKTRVNSCAGPKGSVTATFVYKNTSQSKVLLAAASSDSRCKILDFTKEPLSIGQPGIFTVHCATSTFLPAGVMDSSSVPVLVIKDGKPETIFLSVGYEATKSDTDYVKCINRKNAEESARRAASVPSAPVAKDDCPAFDHSAAGKPFAKVPVEDQKQTGTCYSGATTAMFNYFLATENRLNSRTRSSLVANAYDYKRILDLEANHSGTTKNFDALDGGWHDELLDFIMQVGSCPNDVITKNFGADLSADEVTATYSAFFEALGSIAITEERSNGKPTAKKLAACIKREFETELPYYLGATCPAKVKTLLGDLVSSNSLLACENYLKFLENSKLLECKGEDRTKLRLAHGVETYNLYDYDEEEKQKRKKVLYELLDPTRNAHPFMITVSGCVMQMPKKDLKRIQKVVKECESSHAMMAVGQRRNPKTKKCEVRIRNSWGPECWPYKGTPWGCDPGTGTYWMDRDALEVSLSQAIKVK